MRRFRQWILKFCGLFNKQRKNRELDDEIESHLQMHIEDNLRAGLSLEEARRQALIRLGGIESTKEAYRDQRGLLLEAFWQDVRYGARMLRKNPGFTAVAVLTLALGIGANTAIFSVVDAVLLRPLPYPDSDRLVWAGETRGDQASSMANPGKASYLNFVDWRAQQTVFENIGAYQPAGGSPGAFLIGDEPVRLEVQRMSADAFTVLRTAPLIGRVFGNDEDRPGGAPCVVLSYGTWQKHFGGTAAVVGQSVNINGTAHTVIGIMPPGFGFPYKGVDAWLPLGVLPVPPRMAHNLGTIARLKPGVTLAQARAEMAAIAARLNQTYQDDNKGWKVHVEPLVAVIIGDVGRPLWVLLGAVGMVLLIACANVANLLLARASVRQQEMAVRAALGASRVRIVRQLLVESLLLSVIAAVFGLLLAKMGLDVFIALAGNAIPRVSEVRLNGVVLGFALALAGLTGIIFGLAPAWTGSRAALQDALKAAGDRSSTERGNMRRGLVVAEVALTLLLLVGAGLLLRSFHRLQSVDQGFSGERVLSFDIALPGVKYQTAELQDRFFKNLIEKLAALPGIEEVGTTSRLPLRRKGGNVFSYSVEGQPKPPDRPFDSMDTVVASPGYFKAMGIPLLRGRFFTDQEDANAGGVILVDNEFAKRNWPGEDPIGRRIQVEVGGAQNQSSGQNIYIVVGVVGSIKLGSLSERNEFVQSYVSARQRPGISASIVIKSRLAPAALAVAIREQVRSLDAAQPVHNLLTVNEIRNASLASERLNVSVLGLFALVAFILSVIGLYGLLAYTVARRRREIGVRMALGAEPADIARLVVDEGMRLAGFGILLGIVAAFWLTRWLSRLLFEIKPLDPVTFFAVSLLLLAVALLACWVPARLAAKADPMDALRDS